MDARNALNSRNDNVFPFFCLLWHPTFISFWCNVVLSKIYTVISIPFIYKAILTAMIA